MIKAGITLDEPVIPEAGIQKGGFLDSRLRGNDDSQRSFFAKDGRLPLTGEAVGGYLGRADIADYDEREDVVVADVHVVAGVIAPVALINAG